MILCVEFAEDERWLGGAVYIENLLLVLSALPRAERPKVRLIVRSGLGTPQAKRLAALPIVSGGAVGARLWPRIVRRLDRLSAGRLAPLLRRFLEHERSSEAVLWFPAFEKSVLPRSELYWITDFQHLHLPQLFTDDERRLRDDWFGAIAATPGVLLLSSEAAKTDFQAHYPAARVQPRVWRFCSTLPTAEPGGTARVRVAYGLPEKFLYIPNQFWQHKDHRTALLALGRLREAGQNLPLVCTGYQGDYRRPTHFAEIEALVQAQGLGDRVRFLGVIPRADQIEVFRAAAAVLQPSLFEGWSTVIEDAKALGRPILASDIAVHREQLTGVPDSAFFKAGDADDLAARLAALWPGWAPGPDPAREAAARARGEARRLAAAREFLAIAAEALACAAAAPAA